MGLIQFIYMLRLGIVSQDEGILSPALDFRGDDNSQYIALIF